MSIIDAIFHDYMERCFSLKPNLGEDREKSARMREFEKSFAMSGEQAEMFEQFLFEICYDYQQLAFSDGFKLAFDLMAEVVG